MCFIIKHKRFAARVVESYNVEVSGSSPKENVAPAMKTINGNDAYGNAVVRLDTYSVENIKIWFEMQDSDDTKVGNSLVSTGKRSVFSNTGVAAETYHLKVAREYGWDATTKVTGSWSPDEAKPQK